jgi:hypothetical protein
MDYLDIDETDYQPDFGGLKDCLDEKKVPLLLIRSARSAMIYHQEVKFQLDPDYKLVREFFEQEDKIAPFYVQSPHTDSCYKLHYFFFDKYGYFRYQYETFEGFIRELQVKSKYFRALKKIDEKVYNAYVAKKNGQ